MRGAGEGIDPATLYNSLYGFPVVMGEVLFHVANFMESMDFSQSLLRFLRRLRDCGIQWHYRITYASELSQLVGREQLSAAYLLRVGQAQAHRVEFKRIRTFDVPDSVGKAGGDDIFFLRQGEAACRHKPR